MRFPSIACIVSCLAFGAPVIADEIPVELDWSLENAREPLDDRYVAERCGALLMIVATGEYFPMTERAINVLTEHLVAEGGGTEDEVEAAMVALIGKYTLSNTRGLYRNVFQRDRDFCMFRAGQLEAQQ